MEIQELLQAVFRWMHVVAGVLWIGLLYFFNWVNGPFGKTLDAETKQKALPELLPRALYFFRWGAAWTWITGVILLILIYYHNGMLLMSEDEAARGMATGAAIGAFIVGAVLYDVIWNTGLRKQVPAAVGVSFVLLVGFMAGMHYGAGVGPRALWIHVGALFGSAMAFNVWYRIWPAQRKIIAAIKAGEKPDPDLAALAGLRSKHNTYMSVPLIFIMVSNHYPGFYAFQTDMGWVLLAGIILLGWFITSHIYKRAAGPKPAQY